MTVGKQFNENELSVTKRKMIVLYIEPLGIRTYVAFTCQQVLIVLPKKLHTDAPNVFVINQCQPLTPFFNIKNGIIQLLLSMW